MLTKEDYRMHGLVCGRDNCYSFCPMCGSELIFREVDGKIRPVCSTCSWVYFINPPPVVCVVPYRGEEVLLIKRGVAPKKGEWALPGGFVEVGEAPVEACLRELKEETGLVDIGKVDLISVESQSGNRYGSVVVIGYAVQIILGEKAVPGDDAQDLAWFSVKELPKMPFDSFERIVNKWLDIC